MVFGREDAAEREPVDVEALSGHLRVTVPLLLGGSEGELSRTLTSPDTEALLLKFLEDPTPVMLIGRTISESDDTDSEFGDQNGSANGNGKDAPEPGFFVSLQALFTGVAHSCLVLSKRQATLSPDTPLGPQLRCTTFANGSPFETLQSTLHEHFVPYFMSAIQVQRAAHKIGIKQLRKSLAHVETCLTHLQQDTDIPEVKLAVHPAIQAALEQARSQRREPIEADIPSETLQDPHFISSLQRIVSRWTRDILRVLKMDRDPASGSAMQEISFWLNLDRAISHIDHLKARSEVQLTIAIVRDATSDKFAQPVTSKWDVEANTERMRKKVDDYNQIMNGFPLNDILISQDFARISSAIQNVFAHLKKIRNTRYPIARAQKLVHAISRDLNARLRKMLREQGMMHVAYDEFTHIVDGCRDVFSTWTTESDAYREVLREQLKRTKDSSVRSVRKIAPAHKDLASRLETVADFRAKHDYLRDAVAGILEHAKPGLLDGEDGSSSLRLLDALDDASAVLKEIDVLDTSDAGSQAYDSSIKSYEKDLEAIEAELIRALQEELDGAKNASEMFRIFSHYNSVFVRPRIRGAIKEYQLNLVAQVKKDIKVLQDKFKVSYENTKAAEMSELRDLPPVSAQIIWARQLKRQLSLYLERVGQVLGEGWEDHVEGRSLNEDGDRFRRMLDDQALYEEWMTAALERDLGVTGNVFDVQLERTGGGFLEAIVNFHPTIINLAKEVRTLRSLGFRVPIAIQASARVAQRLYPYAISIKASLKAYKQTVERLHEDAYWGGVRLTVAALHRAVQEAIATGVRTLWDCPDAELQAFAVDFNARVDTFLERTNEAIASHAAACTLIDSLGDTDGCAFEPAAVRAKLAAVQEGIQRLQLDGFVNITAYAAHLDEKVERKFLSRLPHALALWVIALVNHGKGRDEFEGGAGSLVTEELPPIHSTTHEIVIKNQVMVLSPPIEAATQNILEQLTTYLGAFTEQRRLHNPSDTVDMRTEVHRSRYNYHHVLSRLPGGGAGLLVALHDVAGRLAEANAYVHEWLKYQALWDMSTDDVVSRVGADLGAWQRLFKSLKAARRRFDTGETSRHFGPIAIDFARVQARVLVRYDGLMRELVGRFGHSMGTKMKKMFGDVNGYRSRLEALRLDPSDTKEAIGSIAFMSELRRQMPGWLAAMDEFAEGQRTLERNRFAFPDGWLYLENMRSEWDCFVDMFTRKDARMAGQTNDLQLQIVNQDRAAEARLADLLEEWDRSKPVGGGFQASKAIAILGSFETQFNELQAERALLGQAKRALEIEHAEGDVIEKRLEELSDLKATWQALASKYERLEALRAIPWGGVVPVAVRKQVTAISDELHHLPASVRSYDAYTDLLARLEYCYKSTKLVDGLKADAIKERHWAILKKDLDVDWNLSEITLGDVWDVDVLKHEKDITSVISMAQGELGLEQFLHGKLKETWAEYELELVEYQKKTKLIRGWDELFVQCKDDQGALQAMKASPYYKAFAEEADSWDDRLGRISRIFDAWMDVQRRWVYLEGIFTGSADIKQLLPKETSSFQSIGSEFLNLMKKVAKKPLVLDVIALPKVQEQLASMTDRLNRVQKGLTKYLEDERAAFPRFYFVGDEDLLDIIGNSKNVSKIQKHFSKMFAGVTSILLDEGETQCLGIASKEGERVEYKTPTAIKGRKVNQWLTALDGEMNVSLGKLLAESVVTIERFRTSGFVLDAYLAWLDQYQAQLVVLSAQVAWSQNVEIALANLSRGAPGSGLPGVVDNVVTTLQALADTVLLHQPPVRRKKLEHMITELVHQRDVTRELQTQRVQSPHDFRWMGLMRFCFDPSIDDPLKQLTIPVADAVSYYGFEYLGLLDRLVQTPLTDRCYLTMTQALQAKQGGAPFGPAGTGKTESVKSLGAQLGRFVLVFNCDETFDFNAMGRIFIGLCQVGAWGCFDEFNRLEERMLSAVSQQIQSIQLALKAGPPAPEKPIMVELLGKTIPVSVDMASFITMNPGYAGRSALPENLKKLFRNLAMTKPDRQLIAQVMLYSQGFRTAEELARKVVPLFILCAEQLSDQSHYDFGLRSLKSVLVSAGNVKRERLGEARQAVLDAGEDLDEGKISASIDEQDVLITSVTNTMVPKLVAEDLPLLDSLLSDVFPGVEFNPLPMAELRARIADVAREWNFVLSDMFLTKVLQMYSVSNINHGLMLVGPPGVGKSVAWKILLEALERVEGGQEGCSYILDPKAITKDELYGFMDPTTREWTDGIFTRIIRKIIDNLRGEQSKRQWVIFDGDVDPEWVENLNSVLDDNKLLTLPNGERLSLPPCIRIIFEVKDLKHATLATVSRCGMIWFSEEVLSKDMPFKRYLLQLRRTSLDGAELADADAGGEVSPMMKLQRQVADILEPFFESPSGFVLQCLDHAHHVAHVMEYSDARCINALFVMLNTIVRDIAAYNDKYEEFPMEAAQVEAYVKKRAVYCTLWSIVGDCKGSLRSEFCDLVRDFCDVELPPEGQGDTIDYEVTLPEGEWRNWKEKVPTIELAGGKFAGTNVVVPTLDTVRHEDLLAGWLAEHLPIVLCGPPGSGKTMTLFSALRDMPHMEVVGLNFSSETKPELILTSLLERCELDKSPAGYTLRPAQPEKWLVIFCDECNLSAADAYETVRVITFIRQLVEQNGYWDTADHMWVSLERIQFVGACNPPTDPGRVPLHSRLLRHVPVVYVDYPGAESLRMIYGTFIRAVLKEKAQLAELHGNLTDAMVEFFMQTQARFTSDMQPHYIYSPREMTRWVKGVAEAILPVADPEPADLVRVWAHEALRLFSDRLVHAEERAWTGEHIDAVGRDFFGSLCDAEAALARPILYSGWLDPTAEAYVPVERDALRAYVAKKLKAFCEEELDVQLVLFDEVLDHVLRIDRVFKQNQGHMLLIGTSGSGKTTLSRFVAWMNDLDVYQVKVHNQYSVDDFDADLRGVLRRAGPQGEKMVFMIDGDNLSDTAFLERLNTLLANGEVPGLFEGDEYTALMTQCKEGAQRAGLVLTENDELYKWFSKEVMNNCHVVFTMNPWEDGAGDMAATSPALFNRCVLDWFGDWGDSALYQVALEFTAPVALDGPWEAPPAGLPAALGDPAALLPEPPTLRSALVNACVHVHRTASAAARKLRKAEGRSTAITPRHYVDFVNQIAGLYAEKKAALEEQRHHLEVGLEKIRETVAQVEAMSGSLAAKNAELETKNAEAQRKLDAMMAEKGEAEEKKQQAIRLGAELEASQAAALEKKERVLADLAGVEPALADAKEAVGQIGKKQLQELKNLSKPPQAVRVALEATLCLLGHKEAEYSDWKKVRQIITKPEFVPDVKGFEPTKVTPKVKAKVRKEFLSKGTAEELIAGATRASKAAGPLMRWVIAQESYASMLLNIKPLRDELAALEGKVAAGQRRQGECEAEVVELEATIGKLQDEYRVLMRDCGAIEAELGAVAEKVGRSTKLLDSLGGERERWSHGSEGFAEQMATIVGDAFLSGAFVAYAGYFDQLYRSALKRRWLGFLRRSGVPVKGDLSFAEYLSTPDDRLAWKQNALPEDELCTENAILLKRFKRFPLVIDPSGQATEFILRQFAATKMVRTSFLDPKFKKGLETSLRFGTPLMIQDAESFDPILNPVLNNEVKRVAGRVLISIGNTELDLSPSFSVILTARNPAHQFAPDLCSRVTLINFTVTPASLQSQCLNQALKCEQPEVDEQRSDLLKVQGEFRVRLLQLERSLLAALNAAEGSILDDNRIIAQLEDIKTQAASIQAKVAGADEQMERIEATSRQYAPLAHRCSAIFFTLQQLDGVHFLYRYSLGFFLGIFRAVLTENPRLAGVEDKAARLAVIQQSLFRVVFDRVAPGMLHDHRMPLALTFAAISVRGGPDEVPGPEFAYFLSGGGLSTGESAFEWLARDGAITADDARAGHNLASGVACFSNLAAAVKASEKAFRDFVGHPTPEAVVPRLAALAALDAGAGGGGGSAVVRAFRHLLLVQAFRPDRVLARCHLLVEQVLGAEFANSALGAGGAAALQTAVEHEVDPGTAILLCGTSGYDPSTNVEDLYAALDRPTTSIALGAGEAFAQAEAAIAAAAKKGKWVMLKNVHLGPQWLVTLEKKLHALTPHQDFRLFLTSEINPKLPVNLVRNARLFVYEPATGVKATVMRTLQSFPEDRVNAAPAQRARLYFMLAWLNAVVQDRLRYAPIGWTKKYEFGEADLRSGMDTLDKWIDDMGPMATMDPHDIPWDALQNLLASTIYGGRLDNEIDLRLMASFVKAIFTPKMYQKGHILVPADKESGTAAVAAPSGDSLHDFVQWAAKLPDVQSPVWLGLPANAERVLLTARAQHLIINAAKLQLAAEEEDGDDDGEAGAALAAAASSGAGAEAAPAWMKALQDSATAWLEVLPEALVVLERTPEKIKDPMFRYFEREVTIGSKLLRSVRRDLADVIGACGGTVRQTNDIRALMLQLQHGQVPKVWRKYKIPSGLPVAQWVVDFAKRLAQLKALADVAVAGKDLRAAHVWLGGLFNPEAYVTATRQAVAQAHSWSLEKLSVTLDSRASLADVPADRADSFLLTDLRIDGATCCGDVLQLASQPFTTQPLTVLRWWNAEDEGSPSPPDLPADRQVELPMYLNTTRGDVIMMAHLRAPPGASQNLFYDRGVALVCSGLSGI